MITLFLLLSIAGFVTFVVLTTKRHNEQKEKDNGWNAEEDPKFIFNVIFTVIFGLATIGFIIATPILATEVATEYILDNKIAMYEEENTRIEQSVDTMVNAYLQHEHDTFKDLKTDESPITLVTLFPELKSNTLVQQQMEIYVANNQAIKGLREQKVEIGTKKWLLYFGR